MQSPAIGTMTIHLVPLSPAGSSDLPGNSGGQPSNVPLFGLAPGGVYLAPAVTGRTGELLPRHFTLTVPDIVYLTWRYTFCGTFLPVTGTGSYPAPCPAEPGLSSPRQKDWAAVICSTPTYLPLIFLIQISLVLSPINQPHTVRAIHQLIASHQFIKFLGRDTHMTSLTYAFDNCADSNPFFVVSDGIILS